MSNNTEYRYTADLHSLRRNAVGFLLHLVRSVRVDRMISYAIKTFQVALILSVAGVLAHPVPVQAIFAGNNYLEVGDAGDLNSPQFITGGPYEGIVGRIDGAVDVDVFAFHWIGGDFVAEFSPGSDPTIALYDFTQNSLGSASGSAPTLTINNVTADNYLFEISSLTGTNLGYLVHISSPTHPDNTLTISAPTAVPEPTTMILLGSGLLGLAGYGRKKFFKK